MNWYLNVLKKYAVFEGRAQREEYWMFVLFNVLILFALNFLEGLVDGPGVLGLLYSLAVMIPGLAVSIRRLHDTNRSGGMLLILLVPLLGAVVLLVLMAQDGTPGDNQYGANPKGVAA